MKLILPFAILASLAWGVAVIWFIVWFARRLLEVLAS